MLGDNSHLAHANAATPLRRRFVECLFVAMTLTSLVIPDAVLQAADRSPEVEAAVRKGIIFIQQSEKTIADFESGLVVYATLASGQTGQHPLVQTQLAHILKKFSPDGYRPISHHTYEAAVDIMALVALDRDKYLPQIQFIADFLLREQRPAGCWDYLGQDHQGDTSISQYGMLGLWAASRAGINVPPKVWDLSAQWHMRTQLKDGAFSYQPLNGVNGPMHSMSVAGAGSLAIARLFLVDQKNVPPPDSDEDADPKVKKKDKAFGVLERVTPVEPASVDGGQKPVDDANYKPTTGRKELDAHLGGSMAWLGKNYTIDKPTGWPIYYLYGLERAAALTGSAKIGGHDWYKEGSEHLLRTQKPEGAWFDQSGQVAATAFGVLFLCRATEKIVPKSALPPTKKVPTFAGGLLQGGRGLPTDLANVDTSGGTLKAKKTDTPLDRLLADLGSPKADDVESTQAALIEAVQKGRREELIGRKDVLVKLAKDKRVDVRRTAYWALGRCNDLRLSSVLIQGLTDSDFDVSVEARNSLCILSRRPRGFGMPDDVLDKLPESASEVERDAVYEKFRREDALRWKEWYQSVRPYDERDSLVD